MKRFTIMFKLLICVLALSLLSVPVYAKVGDIAGAVYYTDVCALIDGYQIESYSVDGYTAVCAEDLAYYGFAVNWYDSLRLLEIQLLTEYKGTPSEYIRPEITEPAMTYRMPYLETDIQVIADGTVIPSWNIDGRTLIRLEDLSMFGNTVSDTDAHTVSFTSISQWDMIYDILTPPDIYEEKTDISSFDLTFSCDKNGQFHMDGENASYFTPYNIGWNFSAESASVKISFYQNDIGLGLIRNAIDKCTNLDYRDNLAVTPKADIADIITLMINGEEKPIHTVGITQGNGHVDYILSVEGCYTREDVSSVRLVCSIPDGE